MQPGGPTALLEGLNDAQRRAVTTDAAPLCVLAGAGSGKTRVLTRRIAWRVAGGTAHPGHVLALTFTRKAAGELSERLRRLGVRDQMAAGTFHGIAYTQLRRRWADLGRPAPGLLDRKVRILAGLVPRSGSPGAVQPADLAGEIEWAKARMVGPDDYAGEAVTAGRRPPVPPERMAALYRRYEEEKRRRGVVDFDDLLLECAVALEQDAEFAAAQRWRFRHLFVDEFQDVNPAQFRLLTAWLGGRPDLCVVGDPNQAIYSWNGADPTLLSDFAGRFAGATVVRLDDNYRSSPQVLTVAAAVLAPRRASPVALRANRPDGPVPTVRSFASDLDEARGIARQVRDARRPGGAWSDMAVLTRTNAQLTLIQQAMQKVQVPCRVAGGGAFLDQPEVRAALRQLPRGAGGDRLEAWLADVEAAATGSAGPGESPVGPDGSPAGPDGAAPADGSAVEERRLQLGNLARLGREYCAADPSPTGAGFAAWLSATVGAEGDDARRDAVELATFHKAKGLEWPVVFLAGLERGLVPIGRAGDPAAEAEERRLLYVAVTRAELRLHCSWAERRSFGGRALPRSPSPYLDAVEDACRRLSGLPVAAPGAGAGAGAGDARARLARIRRPGRPPSEALAEQADPGLLDALKRWRSDTARASGVPAYVIFHDSTLAAVAAARPTTTEELAGLPGLGPVKTSRYGARLLALVAEHGRSA